MKKSIKIAALGVAALGFAAAPAAGVFADNPSQTDSLSITIADNCALTYDTTKAHTDGGTKESPTGTWSGNTLSYTLANNSADSNIGGTKMHIVCNKAGGYDLKLTAGALTGTDSSSNTISYITAASAPTSSTSNWGVKNDSAWILTGGKVATSANPTAGTDVSVTYGVSATSTQAADVYTGDAVYTLSYPSV